MHKARKEIARVLPGVDIIIELLDARIPYSSSNPLIQEFKAEKPCIKLLHKSDLADQVLTRDWSDYLSDPLTRTLTCSIHEPENLRKIPRLCMELVPQQENRLRPLHTMIMGIPNVGKSSVINVLAGKSVAKTGNEPAITKAQQKIRLADNITLSDTPGVLWPNLENQNSAFRLALTGAIRDTALEHVDVALFAIEYFLANHPQTLKERYNLTDSCSSASAILEQIGLHRGCLGAGRLVDFDKAARVLINDFRSARLGKVTLETPGQMEKEKKQTAELRAEKQAREQARKAARRKKKRPSR